MFNFLNVWISTALEFLHGLVGNYGVAIILLTLGIKLVLFPTTLSQRKMTQKQRAMQPKIDEINRKYANDAERKNQKTMELYKSEKFNPLSGCLPMLLTMPVFFILISVMRTLGNEQIVLMFQQVAETGIYVPESFLWIHNVWQSDTFWVSVIPDAQTVINTIRFVANNPILTQEAVDAIASSYETVMAPIVATYETFKNGWFILPLLVGGVQYLTSQINPMQQAQPAQQKQQGMMSSMGKMMPLMFVFFCATSNTIFTLYWVSSGIFDLVVQTIFRISDSRKDPSIKLPKLLERFVPRNASE